MTNDPLVIASDHAGLELKKFIIEHLESRGVKIVDLGPFEKRRCDYPDYAQLVCEKIQQDHYQLGILVCGTGIGMSMSANKHNGIRAAVVSDVFSAQATRQHNNANVLCLGERVIGIGVAGKIVDAWYGASFEGGRHQDRVTKMMKIEECTN
jgi:ribose 5-phosphate isomerase B